MFKKAEWMIWAIALLTAGIGVTAYTHETFETKDDADKTDQRISARVSEIKSDFKDELETINSKLIGLSEETEMKTQIAALLATQEGKLAALLGGLFAVNAVLTVVKKVVDNVKDKTATQVDNKASAVLGKVLGVVSKILSYATANTQSLPKKVQTEISDGQKL